VARADCAWTRSPGPAATGRCIPCQCSIPCQYNCPVCECPKDELDRTDFLYPLRNVATVKAQVEAAQAVLLEPDGTIKHNCKKRVLKSLLISYCDISP